MNSTNISNISDSVRTAVCNREARPGDVVMLNDLAADAGLSLPQDLPTVQDWAAAADGAICQSLTQATCRGVLNTANAVEAWKMVQQARASEDCRYIGMDLHSTNVVVSVVHNVRDRHGRLVRRKERSQRIDTRDGGVELAKVLAEYCDNNQPHIAVVESTYSRHLRNQGLEPSHRRSLRRVLRASQSDQRLHGRRVPGRQALLGLAARFATSAP